MKESMPSPEEKSKQPEEKKLSLEMTVKKVFDNFLARSDEPGLPYSEQLELAERSVKGDTEAFKQYLESKKSKFRVNSLSGALLAAELFLSELKENKKILLKKPDLMQRITKVKQDIEQERNGGLTEKTVKEVVAIVKEIQSYFE